MKWNGSDSDGKLAVIAEVWESDMSASDISAAIAAKTGEKVSRNAILGFYFRVKDRSEALNQTNPLNAYPLGGRYNGAGKIRKSKPHAPKPRLPKSPKPEKKRVSTPATKPKVFNNDPDTVPVEPSRGLTVLELGQLDCKWPTHRQDNEHRFCGNPRDGTSPYCRHHHARAHYIQHQVDDSTE